MPVAANVGANGPLGAGLGGRNDGPSGTRFRRPFDPLAVLKSVRACGSVAFRPRPCRRTPVVAENLNRASSGRHADQRRPDDTRCRAPRDLSSW